MDLGIAGKWALVCGASKGLAQTPGAAAPAGKAPLALPTPSAADTGPRSADFIVAIVNSEPVTNYEVRSRIARVEQQLAQQGGNAPTPPRELIAREVLERIILEKAQLQLARETGIRMTLPYGGAARQIMVDLDPAALQTYGLTPSDVTTALERSPDARLAALRIEAAQALVAHFALHHLHSTFAQ